MMSAQHFANDEIFYIEIHKYIKNSIPLVIIIKREDLTSKYEHTKWETLLLFFIFQDLLMVIYLSQLTKVNVSLNEKLTMLVATQWVAYWVSTLS